MRIAIPIWYNRISPVFDTASRFLIIEVEGEKETHRFETTLDEQDLTQRCLRIQGLGIDILICGAISRPYSRMLLASEINIIPEISGQAEDVLKAYLQGNLFHSEFLMPGCKRHRLMKEKKPRRQRKKRRGVKILR